MCSDAGDRDFENLRRFKLSRHGDNHEQQRWRHLEQLFPNYELFWQKFVVPLTNRVNPAIKESDPHWIRLRTSIPERLENVVVSHYSVFYYLSRAAEKGKLRQGRVPNFEDDLFFLQTAAENAGHWFRAVKELASDFQIRINYLPEQHPKDYPIPFWKVDAYRNQVLHNPVLGRSISQTETLVPKLPESPKSPTELRNHLKRCASLWSSVEKLRRRDLMDAGQFLQGVTIEIAQFLNEKWAGVISDLQNVLQQPKFIELSKLRPFLPIEAPGDNEPSLFSPSASGNFESGNSF